MITEKRLEELIEQGATIYTSRFNKPEKYKLYKDYFIDKDKLCACNKSHTAIDCVIKLDKLFETEEDAEWYLEFGNITRTETLKLPKWEEFNEEEQWLIFNNGLLIYAISNEDKIVIFKLDNIPPYLSYQEHILYEFEHTKKGYTEACKLCKKLFLGEEV